MFTTTNPDVVFGIAEVKADGETIAKISEVEFQPSGIKFEDETVRILSRRKSVLY